MTGIVHARNGSAAVEFALVILPLMLLIFGGLEFGRLTWMQNVLQQTAITTARCMGVRQTSCTTGAAVDLAKTASFAQGQAQSYSIVIPASAVAATVNGSCAGQSGFALVTITATFITGVPLLSQALGNSQVISVNACFPNQS